MSHNEFVLSELRHSKERVRAQKSSKLHMTLHLIVFVVVGVLKKCFVIEERLNVRQMEAFGRESGVTGMARIGKAQKEKKRIFKFKGLPDERDEGGVFQTAAVNCILIADEYDAIGTPSHSAYVLKRRHVSKEDSLSLHSISFEPQNYPKGFVEWSSSRSTAVYQDQPGGNR